MSRGRSVEPLIRFRIEEAAGVAGNLTGQTSRLTADGVYRIRDTGFIYGLVQEYDIRTNIRGASVTDEIALVALQLDGEPEAVEAAIRHLQGLGVTVEELGA